MPMKGHDRQLCQIIAAGDQPTSSIWARVTYGLRNILALVGMTIDAEVFSFDLLCQILSKAFVAMLKLSAGAIMGVGIYCAKVLLTTFIVVITTLFLIWVILFLVFEKPGLERIFCMV
jgi:hypothetical protein